MIWYATMELQTVKKEECVNYITKKIMSKLRSLFCEYKGKKLDNGKELSGKECLPIARIQTTQNFCDICANKNKPEIIEWEIWVILDHYSSTAEHL